MEGERIRTRGAFTQCEREEWKLTSSMLVHALLHPKIVVVGGTAAWVGIDYVRRDTEPPLEPSKAPHDTLSRTGWALGMLGLLCYSQSQGSLCLHGILANGLCADLPRIRQILLIRRQRTLGNISLYMYLWLISQNVTMLVVRQLVRNDTARANRPVAEHPRDNSARRFRCSRALLRAGALPRKRALRAYERLHRAPLAPSLAACATRTDLRNLQILGLYFRYDHGKPRPESINEGSDVESDAADMAEAGLLSGTERSHSASRPQERSRDRHARLKQLDKHYNESLQLEQKRARGGAGQLPILARRRLATDLDHRAAEEERHWHDSEVSQSPQSSGSSGDELGEARRRLEEKRKRLGDMRTSRRHSDAMVEAAIDKELRTHPLREHIDRRKAESSGRASSTERRHESSGSSDEAEHLRRPSQRSTRSIGKRVFHPRRGVGTDW